MLSEVKDYRPLFKRYFRDYITTKAAKLRISKNSLSSILAGRQNNPEVLKECLEELEEELESRVRRQQRISELEQLHGQLFRR